MAYLAQGNNISYSKDTDWDNEEKYLNNLIKTGNNGQKAWAQNQLNILAKDKAAANQNTTGTTGATGTTETTGATGATSSNNNEMDVLNGVTTGGTPTTGVSNGSTYIPTGTYNDADLPPEALAEIEVYKKAYADAIAKGDTAAAEAAHKAAEAIRAEYGYSGGIDGSDYIAITPVTEPVYTLPTGDGLSSSDILNWNNNYNTNNAKPTYTSKYDPEIDTLLNEILTREDFSYNVENDPLYAQYKTMYNREGDRAMRDTLAEAAASAGGMNSYAITAAQQANNYYNSQLNDRIPELHQLAYEMYLQDKESKVQDLGILTQMDDKQYNRYRDTMSDYYNDKSFAYGAFTDAISQGNWEKTFDYNQSVDNRDYQFKDYWTNKEWTASEQATAKDEVLNLISLGVTPTADLIAKAGMSQIDVDLAIAAVKAGITGETGSTGSTGGSGYTGGGSGGSGGSGGTGFKPVDDTSTTSITDEIKNKCASITNNTELGNYIDGLVASESISPEEGDKLYAQYVDDNEKYKVDADGNSTGEYSYTDMLKSTNGWTVIDNGGVNWFWGVDNNAIVKAPNGEQIRLDNLVDKLVSEGMSKKEAKAAVKALQKNLQIVG